MANANMHATPVRCNGRVTLLKSVPSLCLQVYQPPTFPTLRATSPRLNCHALRHHSRPSLRASATRPGPSTTHSPAGSPPAPPWLALPLSLPPAATR